MTQSHIPTLNTELEHMLVLLERADAISSTTALNELLQQMLLLLTEITHADAGTLYLVNQEMATLCEIQGQHINRDLLGTQISIKIGVLGKTLAAKHPIWVENITTDETWDRSFGEFTEDGGYPVLSLPLLQHNEPVGVVQLLNPEASETRILQVICNRMAIEIDKTRLLKESLEREERLSALIDIIGHIGSTLDRQQLLNLIIENARQLIGAEASSLFLIEQASGDLILHLSTGPMHEKMEKLRVPKGQGIAGNVTETGEIVLVNDVSIDSRHYAAADQASGFATRSIMAVPLITRSISFGSEREDWQEHTIGCIEVLNKIEGQFDDDDVVLLQTLARQAATILEIANLYADANELFLDVIHAMTAAIDAKDPYTEGHSHRVSEYAVAIAQDLKCSAEFIHHLRIGAILHDVGKIGVSDGVLKKPGYLTEEEFAEMRLHPTIGERILGHIRTLQLEIPVIIEHHERLDGSGYPEGLQGDKISLGGRITAVADAFDAITSDRPYRQGLPVEEAFRRLRAGAGTEFDAQCVEALWNAYQEGRIQTQKQRPLSTEH